jgi:anti-anti-sigma factor
MQTPEFHIRVSHDSGRLLVLTLVGELDLATAPSVRDAIAEHGHGYEAIALDLRELTFMDSSGLNLLVELWKRRFEQRIAFVAPTGEVARAIDISGLRWVVPFVDDPRDALGEAP